MDPLGVWNEGVERNNPPKWKDPQDKGAFMWRRETSHIHSSGLGYVLEGPRLQLCHCGRK